jgi:hypothetical protein
MALGTLVVAFCLGRVFVPDSLVHRVFEDGSVRMYGVPVLLIDDRMTLFTRDIFKCMK